MQLIEICLCSKFHEDISKNKKVMAFLLKILEILVPSPQRENKGIIREFSSEKQSFFRDFKMP